MMVFVLWRTVGLVSSVLCVRLVIMLWRDVCVLCSDLSSSCVQMFWFQDETPPHHK